jgi:protein ImuB
MRFLSVFLLRLPTDRILRRRRSAAPEAPFAVWTKIKGSACLSAINAPAEKLGLSPGMTVADARAMHPSLTLAEADPGADAGLLASIADWHRRFTPLAAIDPPDGIMLDVSGAAHLFGGENAMMEEIKRRLAAQGFAARTALAPGPALARALARFQVEWKAADRPENALILKCGAHSDAKLASTFAECECAPTRFSSVRLVPSQSSPEEIEAIAARLPIAALGISMTAQQTLARAGLKTVGDLLARPRAPIAARFGVQIMTRLDALLCRTRDPISPRFEAPDYMAERRFPDGLTRTTDIEATLEGLAKDLCLLLEQRGVGARRLKASFYRVDGVARHIEAGTSRPLRDPARLTALLRERLAALTEEGLDTGYGFDVFRLGATAIELCEAPQTALQHTQDDARLLPTTDESQDLADLVDRLGARLGLRRVLRLYPQEAHLPEFAVAAIPASSPPPKDAARQATFAQRRPLRLFETPEPIEAVALTPDGPPLRFRWRRALHEIAAYEGPERIATPWWSAENSALTRDYFYAEDRQGRKFWLFREGLYERECASPRWFVHGLT